MSHLETMRMKHLTNLASGLRQLADFLEKIGPVGYPADVTLNIFVDNREELAQAARQLTPCEKEITDRWFFVRKNFGPAVKLEINVTREKVCKKVSKGTRVIPAKPEQIIAAQPERTEEVFEWECPDSLLSPTPELGDGTSPVGPGMDRPFAGPHTLDAPSEREG